MQIWFIIGMIFLIIELFSFGLIAIWFSIAAFITMGFYKQSFYNQFYIFVVLSLIFFLLIRKIATKHMKGNSKQLDRIRGKTVKIQEINRTGNRIIYTVFLDGKTWSAISDDILQIDAKATVIRIEGNKLILKKSYNEI